MYKCRCDDNVCVRECGVCVCACVRVYVYVLTTMRLQGLCQWHTHIYAHTKICTKIYMRMRVFPNHVKL